MGDPRFIFLVMLLLLVLIWNWRFIGLDKIFGGGGGGRRKAATAHCRWRQVAPPQSDHPAVYHCDVCGAEVGTTDGQTPTRCMRPRRGG